MPTLKSVIYKHLKQHCLPLAEWYKVYRIEHPCNNDSSHRVNKLIQEEIAFWEEELDILHLDQRKKEQALEKLHHGWDRYTYVSLFEVTILPLLLEGWLITR